MTWTTPRTWVAGETVTAAIMNAHVRDNLNALKNGVQYGTVSLTFSAAIFATATVTFPIAFAGAPQVAAISLGSSTYFAYLSSTPTTTSVTIGLRSYSSSSFTGTVPASWIAAGPM